MPKHDNKKITNEQIVEEIIRKIHKEARKKAQTVQKGMTVICRSNHRFTFSKKRYLTKGKKYEVIDLQRETGTVKVNADIDGEYGWLSPYGYDLEPK